MKVWVFGILFGGEGNMLKGFAKWLATLLIIVSVTTFVNVIALYWIPINVPLNSFFAVRLAFVAMIESRYYLSFISLLISALLFLSAISIRRKRIILPMLTFVYIMYDYIIVWLLAIDCCVWEVFCKNQSQYNRHSQ